MNNVSQNSEKLVHVVKEGESLYTIAKLYFGNGMKYSQIIELNQIEDPKNIKMGQQLRIR